MSIDRIFNLRVNADTQKIKEATAALPKLTKSYENAKRELANYRKELRGVNKLTDEQAAKLSRLQAAYDKTNTSLRNGRKAAGNLQSSFGGLTKSLGSMALRFTGVAAIAGGLFKLFSTSIKTIKDFEQASANLAAIFGKSTEEISGLIDQAKELGSVTQFTASQVLELQGALAKLGFTEIEITNSTADILNLAAALDVDLGRAAEIAGSTIRQFGLDASEAGRVADVFAIASSKSAVNAEFLAESLKTAGAAADASGISLEKTAALIGTIANSGLDASTAGTALRNIFIELGASGLTLEDALDKIASSQNKLSTATDLFGKRSAVSALILANNRTELQKLDDQLQSANRTQSENDSILSTVNQKTEEYSNALKEQGLSQEEVTKRTEEYKKEVLDAVNAGENAITASRIAAERNDTLQGSLKRLSSAWEGLVLSFSEGGNVLRTIIDLLVDVVNGFAGSVGGVLDVFDDLFDAFGDFSSAGDEVLTSQERMAVAFDLLAIPIKALVRGVTLAIRSFQVLIESGKRVANFFGSDFELNDQVFSDWADAAVDSITGVQKDYSKAVTFYEISQKEIAKGTTEALQSILDSDVKIAQETKDLIEDELILRRDKEKEIKKLANERNNTFLNQIRKEGDLLKLQEELEIEQGRRQVARNDQEKELIDGNIKAIVNRIQAIQDASDKEEETSKKASEDRAKRAADEEKKKQEAARKALQTRKEQLEEEARIELARSTGGDEGAELEKLAIEYEERQRLAKENSDILLETIKKGSEEEEKIIADKNNTLKLEEESYQRDVDETKEKFQKDSLDAKLSEIETNLKNEQKLLEDGVTVSENVEQDKLEAAVKASQAKLSVFEEEVGDISALSKEQKEIYDDLVTEFEKRTAEAKPEGRTLFEQLTSPTEEESQVLKEKLVEFAGQISDAVFDAQNERTERTEQNELDSLERQNDADQNALQTKLENNLITQADYDIKSEELEAKTQAKQLEIQKKAFQREKRLSIAQALINGALAITKALINPLTAPIVIPSIIASTAVQVGAIAAQKFRKGGVVPEYQNGGLLQGASHERGGIPIMVGGGQMIEAEGGEFIINRRATAANFDLLNSINQSAIPLTPVSNNLSSIEAEANATVSAINRNIEDKGALRAVVVESDVTNTQNRIRKFEKFSEIG
jgi:hypothetical protein